MERPPEQVIERGGSPLPPVQQQQARTKTPVKQSASSSLKEGGEGGSDAPEQKKRSSLRARLPSVGLGGSSKGGELGKEGSSGSSSHHPPPPAQPKDPDAQLEGWLKKRGTRIPSHWSDRYFTLKGDQLLYYLKPTDQVC